MQIIKSIPVYIIPVLILITIIGGLFKVKDVYSLFLEGAVKGLKITADILPALVGLIVAISMLRASGAIEIIAHFLAPALSFIGLPAEVLPLALLRPVSGSASLGIVGDIFKTYGPDSYIGKVASVIMGSTETTFYTIAVYYSAAKIRNIRHTLSSALTADAVGILAGVILCKIFY